MKILQPEGWDAPVGYANGISVRGRQVYVAGQVGWNPATSRIETADLAAQVRQALANIVAVLGEAGAEPRHLVRLTWYILDKSAYVAARREIGRAYREVIGRHYPPMSLVVVADLLEEGALVEIEATAVVPEWSPELLALAGSAPDFPDPEEPLPAEPGPELDD